MRGPTGQQLGSSSSPSPDRGLTPSCGVCRVTFSEVVIGAD